MSAQVRTPDEGVDAIDEILSRSYVVTSTDGAVTVRVDAEGRLLDATVIGVTPGKDLSIPATESVQRSQDLARDETARALAEVPGIDPQLRSLLMGEI